VNSGLQSEAELPDDRLAEVEGRAPEVVSALDGASRDGRLVVVEVISS